MREPGPVRGGEHRVAGDREQRPDLAWARGLDLLGQRGDRQLAAELRQVPDPAAPGVEVTAPGQAASDHVDHRRGEHRAADPVEVAGDQVEHLDRPLRHGPELLGRHADPAVGNGAVGGGELPRDAADHAGGYAAHRFRAFRGEGRDGRPHGVQPVHVGGQADQTLIEDHRDHGEQDERVGARPHEVVLGGDLGGLRAARVEDHHPTSTGLQLAQPAGKVRRGHQ